MFFSSLSPKQRHHVTGIIYSILGAVIFAFGLNIFIIPLSLYNSGFMGVAQLIRTFIVDVFHLSLGQVDISGFVYLLLNIPLIILAWTKMGRGFFIRTVITIVVQTAAMTLIPIPRTPLIEDYLTACIIGGLVAGAGSGLVLRGSSSGGGQDILGVYLAQRFPGFSVGKVAIIINIFVYGVCLFLFNIEITIYSLIYGVIYSLACDRMHIQNINVSVMIFTKKSGIPQAVMEQMGRGVTSWEGAGAYTNEYTQVLMVMINKYEIHQLRQIVHSIDSQAFMIFTEGCSVTGNFERRLTG